MSFSAETRLDRGRITVSRGMWSLQRPREVSVIVRPLKLVPSTMATIYFANTALSFSFNARTEPEIVAREIYKRHLPSDSYREIRLAHFCKISLPRLVIESR